MDDVEEVVKLTEQIRNMWGVSGAVMGKDPQAAFEQFDDWFLTVTGLGKD